MFSLLACGPIAQRYLSCGPICATALVGEPTGPVRGGAGLGRRGACGRATRGGHHHRAHVRHQVRLLPAATPPAAGNGSEPDKRPRHPSYLSLRRQAKRPAKEPVSKQGNVPKGGDPHAYRVRHPRDAHPLAGARADRRLDSRRPSSPTRLPADLPKEWGIRCLHSHPAGPHARRGHRQAGLPHQEGRIGAHLLEATDLDGREIGLNLLQRPTRPYRGKYVLQREPVTTDARLAAHLAWLDRDPAEALQCRSMHSRDLARPWHRSRRHVLGPRRSRVAPVRPPP